MVLTTSSINGARAKSRSKFHAPGLDLGEVENVVDQREQVPARAEHAVERLGILLQRLGILPQHLADADNGVERRAQLVAHIGEELRLVLACLCELPALLLDLAEQARVLDSEHRLGGKRLEQLDRAFGERSPRCGRARPSAPTMPWRIEWNGKHGAIAGRMFAWCTDVGSS